MFSGEMIHLNLLNVVLGFAAGMSVGVRFHRSRQLKLQFQLQNIKITESKREHL